MTEMSKVVGCNPARPSARTFHLKFQMKKILVLRRRQIPPGNANLHTATPGDMRQRPRAMPAGIRQRPELAGNARPSGNANGHPAMSGAIWQRQVPFGNAKFDLGATDAPGDAPGDGDRDV